MRSWHHRGLAIVSVPPAVVVQAARLKEETAEMLERMAGAPHERPWLRSLASVIRNVPIGAWLEAIEKAEI